VGEVKGTITPFYRSTRVADVSRQAIIPSLATEPWSEAREKTEDKRGSYRCSHAVWDVELFPISTTTDGACHAAAAGKVYFDNEC
jgi:hypothetical protein